jgi:hypothetical protein
MTVAGEEEPEQREEKELAAQLEAATDALRAAALRLLQEGETHPQLIVLAAAAVAGELGACMALADGQDLEVLLGELAAVVRQAGREHQAALRGAVLPVAGNA